MVNKEWKSNPTQFLAQQLTKGQCKENCVRERKVCWVRHLSAVSTQTKLMLPERAARPENLYGIKKVSFIGQGII